MFLSDPQLFERPRGVSSNKEESKEKKKLRQKPPVDTNAAAAVSLALRNALGDTLN